MKRLFTQDLLDWHSRKSKKPLVIYGARQVGKTYGVNMFGESLKKQFDSELHTFDFMADKQLAKIFDETNDPNQIIKQLEIKSNIRINKKKDILFFDELQESKSAVTSFKYFAEKTPEISVVGAGSYMGLIKNEGAFPVGKINILNIYPMNFYEFIENIKPELIEYINNFNLNECDALPAIIHEEFLNLYRNYLITGGLPEVVKVFYENYPTIDSSTYEEIRRVQRELIQGYESDFSKHSGTINATHLFNLFHAIPTQLSKNNEEPAGKFAFKSSIPNVRGYSRIEAPLSWLTNCGLCIKNFIAKKAGIPIGPYIEHNKFKLYFFDIGLLNALLSIPIDSILNNNWGEYKGYIIENFVAQELYSYNSKFYAWQEGQAEIEFLLVGKKDLIPLEVKSATKSKRSKSLDSYNKKYSPTFAIKATCQNASKTENRHNTIPIYLVLKLNGF